MPARMGGRKRGVDELVSSGGELSKIDDFILHAFPFIFNLFPLVAIPAHPPSNSIAEADEAKMGLLWREIVSVPSPR